MGEVLRYRPFASAAALKALKIWNLSLAGHVKYFDIYTSPTI
jgi:hypothetical protein